MSDESGKYYKSINDPLANIEGEDHDWDLVVGEIMGKNLAEMDGDKVDESGLDPWIHKLNPSYWLKSSREKRLIDAERKLGKENVAEQKRLQEQRKELQQAERTMATAEAAHRVKQESEDVEARLRDIEQSVSSGVGAEGPTKADAVKVAAARKGQKVAKANKKVAGSLEDKLERGEDLTAADRAKLRNCLLTCGSLRKLHRALSDESETSGEYSAEIVGATRKPRARAGSSVSKKQWITMSALAAVAPGKLKAYLAKQKLVLNPQQKGHVRAMAGLTKRALIAKGQGKYVSKTSGDSDVVGISFWKAAMYAALPVTALAYGTYKATKYVGKKIFGKKGGGDPEAARQARIEAAQARMDAAMARQSGAQEEADTVTKARQAEADAAQAEADAKAAYSAPVEAQAPADGGDAEADADAQADDQQVSGEYVNDFTDCQPSDFTGAFVGAIADPKHKQIVAAAATDTPTGKKIRSGAALYSKAKKGDKKSIIAIENIRVSAAKGNPQAQRDYNAVKAGKIALTAKGKAKRSIASKSRNDKGRGIQAKFEKAAGDRLARASRARALGKVAKVERRAAKGDPKAKAAIAKTVAAAHKGDPKAKTTAAALLLARRVRTSAPTPRERRNLAAAHRVVRAANKGNRKAIQRIQITQAAAKGGNPNAKRAMARLNTAAAVNRTITTGKIQAAPATITKVDTKRYTQLKSRVASGSASREEAVAASKMAHQMGLREESAALAARARTLRPATEPLKQAAITAAAAQQGHEGAQGAVKEALEWAQEGDPAGINAAGHLAAVQALDDVRRGKPMPREIAEATALVERAHAGDPEAMRTVDRIGAGAQSGDPKAVKAAIALTAAAAVVGATAGSTVWSKKAGEARGQKLGGKEAQAAQGELADILAKVHAGTASRAEGRRGCELAMALGKPGVCAQISAMMPPDEGGTEMSSMPDVALPEITSKWGLLKEAFRALLFATPDPLQNYREGAQTRGDTEMKLLSAAPAGKGAGASKRVAKKGKKA